MYRFLLSRRWIGLAVFVVFMASISWFLGNWQLDRLETRRISNARAEAHISQAPIDIAQIVDDTGKISQDKEWTNVSLTGEFRTDIDVVVRYIKRDNGAGVEVVTPFVTTAGDTVLVKRGWMASANTGARPDNIPPAPSGEVTVTGWWHPDVDAASKVTKPLDDSVRAIDSRAWTERLGTKALPGYVSRQTPEMEGLLAEVQPDFGEGPHLFYAIQWFFFGLLAIFGGFWFVRAEVKEQREAQAKLTKSK